MKPMKPRPVVAKALMALIEFNEAVDEMRDADRVQAQRVFKAIRLHNEHSAGACSVCSPVPEGAGYLADFGGIFIAEILEAVGWSLPSPVGSRDLGEQCVHGKSKARKVAK